jgi:hypothetical protein
MLKSWGKQGKEEAEQKICRAMQVVLVVRWCVGVRPCVR